MLREIGAVALVTNRAIFMGRATITRWRRSFLIFTLLWAAESGTPALAEWYAGAYLGSAHTFSGSLLLSQPSSGTQLRFSPVRYRSDSFQLPLYYGYRVGYFLPFAPYLGAEAEFVHLKVFAETDRSVIVEGQRNGRSTNQQSRMDEIVHNFSISHGMKLVVLNAALRYPMRKKALPPRTRRTQRNGIVVSWCSFVFLVSFVV